VISIVLFAHLVWLGFYLINRARGDRALQLAGGATVSLGAALAVTTIDGQHAGGAFTDNTAVAWAAVAIAGMALAGLEMSRFALDRVQRPVAKFAIPAIAMVSGYVAFFVLEFSGIEFGWEVVALPAVGFLAIDLWIQRQAVTEAGEALLPDLVRSYDYAFLISGVFGGQIVIAMATGPGATETMLWLLHGILVAAIATQVFLDRLQGLLDSIAFANVPWLRKERSELRSVENLLPRVNTTDPLTMEEDEFARLTRRALGNFSDLTRLATSPLTNLPEVHRRLAQRGVEPTTLERARELKLILAEAIERLRPHAGGEYGTTDEWRFYNALYYPYVIGMRPYSRRTVHGFDDPSHDEVLDWFRTYVPERTLYNWQNAAAALVAGDLREHEVAALSSPQASPALIG
jgi:branched-subunit amino acid ABC-type transport system permease component